jgi:hypothetical protein
VDGGNVEFRLVGELRVFAGGLADGDVVLGEEPSCVGDDADRVGVL